MTEAELFKSRVYGVQIIKSKNSNYNADFTGAPRSLPDGTVYSTDKVNKFNIRNYLGRNNANDIFVKQSIHSVVDTKKVVKTGPRTLAETYQFFFCKEGQKSLKNQTKIDVLRNLLSKLDIRLFGATFAPKGGKDAEGKNISIHGPVQISYGINRYEELKDSGMYTDQIGSPYARESGAYQSTLGSQTRSQEAHYVHHFSINPKNLSNYVDQFQADVQNGKKGSFKDANSDFQLLTKKDIQLLKEAMSIGTTYYDSTSKKDSENELLLWIELKKNSEKVLKNFADLIDISTLDKRKTQIDFNRASKYLNNFMDDILSLKVLYDQDFTEVENLPKNCKECKNLNDIFDEE